MQKEIKDEYITRLHGCPYDLRGFISKHPGGDQLKIYFGEDATAMYYAQHPEHKINSKTGHSFKLEEMLKKYKLPHNEIDLNKDLDKDFEYDTAFGLAIRKEWTDYFKNNNISPFANWKWWTKALIYMSINIFFERLYYINPSYINAIPLGISMALVALNIAHDANHGSVSKYPWINKLLGRTADWLGHSQYVWTRQHSISHHQYTNDEKLDYNSDRLKPIINFTNNGKNWFQRNFQGIYVWPLLPISWILLSFKYKAIIIDGYLACFIRIIFLLRIFVNPMIHHGLFHGFCMGLVTMWTGATLLSHVFNLSHHFVGVVRKNLKNGDDWYEHQVISTSDYGGTISSYVTGGLNIQIIHHLFPKTNSIHYVALQPIIEKVCKEHDINYVQFPWIHQNILSTMKYFGLPSFISNRLNVINNHNYKQK